MRRYCPKPWTIIGRLRMPHDAPDYLAVAISHIVILRRPPLAATVFAGRDQKKLRTSHQ
jgi:hypothetical protein